MPNPAVAAFAAWLTERCEFLRALEARAHATLQEDKDTEKYKALMCQKAMFLQALPEEAVKHAVNLPDEVADMAMGRLDTFASNASRALSIDSVFYMYALLYPENHVQGDPNNLERLAAEIQALAER